MAIRVVLLLLASMGTLQAQAVCKETYGACMAACATEPMAERCMQRCAPLRDRCAELRTDVSAATPSTNKFLASEKVSPSTSARSKHH